MSSLYTFSVHCQLSTRPDLRKSRFYCVLFLSVNFQCPSGNVSCLLKIVIQFSIRSNGVKHKKKSVTLRPIQLLKTTFETTMLKRARHPPAFYVSLFEELRNRGCNLKYRPRSKPITLGVYQVERIVPKRIQGGKCEFFVQWKDYSAAENTWEPSEHIPEELIAAFESRCVDSVRIDECKERLALVFERGLKYLPPFHSYY